MKQWIETIHIRLNGNLDPSKPDLLRQLIENIPDSDVRVTLSIFHRAGLSKEYGVFVFHQSSELDENVSELGKGLFPRLKEMGMVNHSVWLESV